MIRLQDGWWCPELLGGPGNYLRRAADVDLVLPLLRENGFAIQAGGHIGTVPARLAQHFDMVMTLEPHPDNFAALVKNLETQKLLGASVIAIDAALGDGLGWAQLRPHNRISGQHQVNIGHAVPTIMRPRREDETAMTTIDQLVQGRRVDAIFLDVEGTEIFAIRGARETIAKWKPVIMVEENKRCREHGFKEGQLPALIQTWGYQLEGRVGEDLIFAPRSLP